MLQGQDREVREYHSGRKEFSSEVSKMMGCSMAQRHFPGIKSCFTVGEIVWI